MIKIDSNDIFFNIDTKIDEIIVDSSIINYHTYFERCDIDKVVIKKEIESPPDRLFDECHIKEIIFEDGVTTVPPYICDSCIIGNCKLADSIEIIGPGAFYGCNISEINMPENLTIIATEAFAQSDLPIIEFPESLVCISRGAFFGATAFEFILNKELRIIAQGAFSTRHNVWVKGADSEEYNLSDDKRVINFKTDQVIVTIGNKIYYANMLSDKIFDEKIKTIMPYAFENFHIQKASACKIEFTNLEKIEHSAFSGSAIQNIILPPNIDTIPIDCFSYSKLNDMDFSNFKQIEHGAFKNCNFKDRIIDLSTVKDIEKYAFSKTQSAGVILATNVKSSCFEEALINGNLILKPGITTICHNAFNYAHIENIDFPYTIKLIGDSAFGNVKLDEIELPNEAVIYSNSFRKDTNIKTYNNVVTHLLDSGKSISEINQMMYINDDNER